MSSSSSLAQKWVQQYCQRVSIRHGSPPLPKSLAPLTTSHATMDQNKQQTAPSPSVKPSGNRNPSPSFPVVWACTLGCRGELWASVVDPGNGKESSNKEGSAERDTATVLPSTSPSTTTTQGNETTWRLPLDRVALAKELYPRLHRAIHQHRQQPLHSGTTTAHGPQLVKQVILTHRLLHITFTTAVSRVTPLSADGGPSGVAALLSGGPQASAAKRAVADVVVQQLAETKKDSPFYLLRRGNWKCASDYYQAMMATFEERWRRETAALPSAPVWSTMSGKEVEGEALLHLLKRELFSLSPELFLTEKTATMTINEVDLSTVLPRLCQSNAFRHHTFFCSPSDHGDHFLFHTSLTDLPGLMQLALREEKTVLPHSGPEHSVYQYYNAGTRETTSTEGKREEEKRPKKVWDPESSLEERQLHLIRLALMPSLREFCRLRVFISFLLLTEVLFRSARQLDAVISSPSTTDLAADPRLLTLASLNLVNQAIGVGRGFTSHLLGDTMHRRRFLQKIKVKPPVEVTTHPHRKETLPPSLFDAPSAVQQLYQAFLKTLEREFGPLPKKANPVPDNKSTHTTPTSPPTAVFQVKQWKEEQKGEVVSFYLQCDRSGTDIPWPLAFAPTPTATPPVPSFRLTPLIHHYQTTHHPLLSAKEAKKRIKREVWFTESKPALKQLREWLEANQNRKLVLTVPEKEKEGTSSMEGLLQKSTTFVLKAIPSPPSPSRPATHRHQHFSGRK